MRKVLAIAVMLIAPALAAQTPHQLSVQDEIALTRSELQADRQAIVTASLKLTDDESKKFWPMYRDYRADMDKPMDRLWNLFVSYGEKWDTLSSDDARKMLNEYFDIEKDVISTKMKWAGRMNKELKGTTVARFFQIDNKLDSILRLGASSEIPLIENK